MILKQISTSVMLFTVPALATLTPTLERGERNVYFNSPRGVQEVCVIPKHYPGAKYKKKDLKKEVELCNASFYDLTSEEESQGRNSVALCAKLNSTNPGINVYELGPNQSKSDVESKDCKNADKLAKYKNSTSCSYTPSIIGYYHLSRILGGVGRVPVSVLRTMDIETHKQLGNKVKKEIEDQKKTNDLIYQTWSGLMSNLNQGLNSSKKDQLLTDDGQQSYGGLIVNPKKEDFYTELFTKGPDRAVAFKEKNLIFKNVRDPRNLSDMFDTSWTQANVQAMFAMKDATEFILMDHIMDQQDRFGNIAEIEVNAYMAKDDANDEKYELQIEKDINEYKKAKEAGLVDPSRSEAFEIKSMVLKDNDCGVTKTNVVKAAGLLKEIRHMDPKTYKKLLQFQASVLANKTFFTRNLMFTATDFNELVANINDAVSILQKNCNAGLLKLDLDVDHYLETGELNTGSCLLSAD